MVGLVAYVHEITFDLSKNLLGPPIMLMCLGPTVGLPTYLEGKSGSSTLPVNLYSIYKIISHYIVTLH